MSETYGSDSYANMPMIPSSFGMSPPPASDTIAAMRWENDPLIFQLYKILGGKETRVVDGRVEFYRPDNSLRPLVNDVGIDRILSIIRGIVNPVSSLSNIDVDRADILSRQVLINISAALVQNTDRWDVHPGDLSVITTAVRPIVFMQLSRAVNGHESLNYRTQTFEQNVQQHMSQQGQSSGFNLFGLFRRR